MTALIKRNSKIEIESIRINNLQIFR